MTRPSRNRNWIAAATVLATLAALPADAQDNKKNRPQSNQSTSSSSQSTAGWPSCNGLLWVGTFCRLGDGRVCRVDAGSSGNAILAECK